MAHFIKPSSGPAGNYVLDKSGTLLQVKVPLGGSAVVHLWGGDGKGNPLRVSAGNLATVREASYSTVSEWTYAWTVTGNVKGKGKLVGLGMDDNVWAEIPLEITDPAESHNWGQPQPAPQTLWHIVHQNFPRVRFSGIMREPGHQDHSEGRAVDLGLFASQPEEAQLAGELISLLLANSKELGWAYFIWNRQIWSGDTGTPTAYTGDNPHTDHIHISWSRENSQRSHFPSFAQAVINLRHKLNPAP
jgi:hypothetical protein